MEINEEIVKEYFTTCRNCFVRENVIFKVETHRHSEGKKKGGGWSDIDLLAYDPINDEILDIEVKYRHVAPFHLGADRASSLKKVIDNFKVDSRRDKIDEHNSRKVRVGKVFVTNRKAFTNTKRAEYERLLAKENIELIYFEAIFSELQKHIRENSKKMTSVIGQVLRIIDNQEKGT